MEITPNQNKRFLATSKQVFALALPMAGSQLLNVGSGFLCMAMLSRLGNEVLAASALIFSTQMALMVTGMSLLFSLSVLVGHAYGEKNYTAIGGFLQCSWALALLLSLPVMVLFWHIGSVLIFFGQTPTIAQLLQDYFRVFVWAVVPGMLSTCNMQFGYGVHRKKLMFFISLLGVGVLLGLAYLFIFGKMGLPKMGVAGLALAAFAQYSFFLIVTTLFFYFEKNFKQFGLFKSQVKQRWQHLLRIVKMGWPISVQMGGELLSFFVSGIMVGWLGANALGAFQIMNQYVSLIIIPIFSFSQASGILISHACGAKQYHEIKKISYASIMIILAISLVIAGVFIGLPKQLVAFYLNVLDPANATIVHLTILLFSIVAVSQLFDALRIAFTGILRGLFDTRVPMYISLLTSWGIYVPLAYILAFTFKLGIVGFVLGGALGLTAGAMMMAYRCHRFMVKTEQIHLEGSHA